MGTFPKKLKVFIVISIKENWFMKEQNCLNYLKSVNAPKLSETDKETVS